MGSTLSTYLPDDDDVGKWSRVAAGAAGLAIALHGAFGLIKMFVRASREDRLLKKFPGPPQHWLLGNLPEFSSPDGPVLAPEKWTKTFGSPFRGRVGPFLNFIGVSDPEGMKVVMSTTEPKDKATYRFFEPFMGGGLLLSEGELHARNRKLLTPAFHFDILKQYVTIFSSSTKIMIGRWREALKHGPRLEMFEHVSLMMLHSILKCAFGYEGNVQAEGKNDKYIESLYKITTLIGDRFNNPLIHNPTMFNLSYTGYKFRQALKVIRKFSKGVLDAKRREKAGNSDAQKGRLHFIDILLEAKDADGHGLTDKEIQCEVDTFMFAGHDTTASGLSWFLYNIARHPEHQTKCRAEVQQVLGERDDVTWEDLSKLTYLTLCLKESLRLHSPVSAVARRTTKPMKLREGLIAPADMAVSMSISALHRNPRVWEDPEKYDPLRFTPENSKDRSPYAFLPFAAGPRNCIGQHFAMNELKTCSALLLKHFEFSVTEEPLRFPALVLRAQKGIWLNVKEL